MFGDLAQKDSEDGWEADTGQTERTKNRRHMRKTFCVLTTLSAFLVLTFSDFSDQSTVLRQYDPKYCFGLDGPCRPLIRGAKGCK